MQTLRTKIDNGFGLKIKDFFFSFSQARIKVLKRFEAVLNHNICVQVKTSMQSYQSCFFI